LHTSGGSSHCCHRVKQACFVRLAHATIAAASYGIKQFKKKGNLHSTAHALAIRESPGRDTGHCWSSVRSLIDYHTQRPGIGTGHKLHACSEDGGQPARVPAVGQQEQHIVSIGELYEPLQGAGRLCIVCDGVAGHRDGQRVAGSSLSAKCYTHTHTHTHTSAASSVHARECLQCPGKCPPGAPQRTVLSVGLHQASRQR